MLSGVDVSKWQATTPNLSGLSFLFARATYGTNFDPRYAMHIANARKAGLLVGAYHFGVNAPVGAQVSAFLRAAGAVDFYVLDLESDGARPRMTDAQARAFITAVRATGRKIGLYHSRSGFPSLGQNYNWVALWTNTAPGIPWTFWQYAGTGVDRDKFAGTLAALQTLAHGPQPTPIPMPRVVTTAPTPSERNVMIAEGGLSVTSSHVMRLAKGQPLYRYPGGPRVTAMGATGPVPYIGSAGSAWRAVQVRTRGPYTDRVVRPTILYVPKAAGQVEAR